MASPLPTTELERMVSEACEAALDSAEKYDHSQVETWNSKIINTILQSLIDKTKGAEAAPAYKFICNSTIIQHPSEPSTGGKRGMHSAVGAYWNGDKDGTWSYKWESPKAKTVEIVVSITWIGL